MFVAPLTLAEEQDCALHTFRGTRFSGIYDLGGTVRGDCLDMIRSLVAGGAECSKGRQVGTDRLFRCTRQRTVMYSEASQDGRIFEPIRGLHREHTERVCWLQQAALLAGGQPPQ